MGVSIPAAPAVAEIPALDVAQLERDMLVLPQTEIEIAHHFAPGVYLREGVMPKGAIVIGHEHKTDHFTIFQRGRFLVRIGDAIKEFVAPCFFVAPAGSRKIFYIIEETVGFNVHPTHETDLEKLADELIVKSDGFTQHVEIEQLKLAAASCTS